MKRNSDAQRGMATLAKRAGLLMVLVLACWLMSACYMEPDRVVDANNGLTVDNNGQNFENVITPTPEVTATPTPAPSVAASPEVDWTQWNFGQDTVTNPPSNVSTAVGGTTTVAPFNPIGGTSTMTVTTSGTPTPTSTTNTSSSDTLRSGSTGSEVKRLQTRLKELKYYNGSVDGTYGSGTTSAVKAFQTNNGLTADGVAGKATLEKLYGYYAVAAGSTNTSPTKKPSSGTSSGGSSGSSTTASSYTNGRTDVYLKVGDSGAQVKILQNRLIVLGYLSGTADGSFAETTEAAVISFQNRNSIYADGIAGPTTLTKLYSSSAKKASSVVANLGSLKEGMSGSAVRSLQSQLKTLGYYTGSIDGDYGAGTTAAVLAFQQDNGLTADGIAGKATQNAIYGGTSTGGSSGGGSSTTSGSSPARYGATASSNGYTTISSTSKTSSSNVKALQSALSSTGYYAGELDGAFGNGTASAISAYQQANGLRVTGMAGPSTQRLLYGGTSESGSYSKLDVGSSGSAVKRLQYALYELKYYDGDITGKYDEVTKNAVYVFQEVNGLYMDGIAGQETQQKLFSSNAIPCNI